MACAHAKGAGEVGQRLPQSLELSDARREQKRKGPQYDLLMREGERAVVGMVYLYLPCSRLWARSSPSESNRSPQILQVC